MEDALREELDWHCDQMQDPKRFGNTLKLREESYDVWGWTAVDNLIRDARYDVCTAFGLPVLTIMVVASLSIGIGVNLAHAPGPDAVEPDALTPTALAQYGPRVEPQALLDELAPAFARWETQFRTQGFAPIRNAWLSRTSHLGDRIRVRLAGETVTGLFQDIDQSGNLVLAMARETRAIAAGDVYFGG